MDNPSAKLYNAAKQKLLDGKQVFSWTQSLPDPAQYWRDGAALRFRVD